MSLKHMKHINSWSLYLFLIPHILFCFFWDSMSDQLDDILLNHIETFIGA